MKRIKEFVDHFQQSGKKSSNNPPQHIDLKKIIIIDNLQESFQM
jgi:hypothetical protein